ncbi:MAG: hypothetical protein PHD21_00350 [Flavobacteriales bacterium]|nr:hypothetical protein [Flavobacteriales bacterium]
MFVGSISDNFDERIEHKIFHCEIVVDNARVTAETKAYQKIPSIMDFTAPDGTDNMQQQIQANYDRIKQEVAEIVTAEIDSIKNYEKLSKLIKNQ